MENWINKVQFLQDVLWHTEKNIQQSAVIYFSLISALICLHMFCR